MNKKNVWTKVKKPLELHVDNRGKIADIFYDDNIQHVAIIKSQNGALRGDHYHKHTVQHMLITKGTLEYWHKRLGSKKPAKCEVLRTGDMVTTPANEIHALRMIEDNEFVVFTQGKRGGKDYESDTFRVQPSIIPGRPVESVKKASPRPKMLKLHLGCGRRYLPGYIHVDLDQHPHIDYCHDIKNLPMFESGSVSEIYTCGAFEYFDRATEVQGALLEWKRVLKKGGRLRIAVPDFAGVAKVYKKYGNVDGIGILGPIFGRIEIVTEEKHEILYHKTVYDLNSIKKVLEKAGFMRIKRYNWKTFLPEGYDDFSAAYVPHMDTSGIPMSLNIVCSRND
jgi:predicted SAM-dependent methyltransferase/quercetin dioxygenase-like cupin family protein